MVARGPACAGGLVKSVHEARPLLTYAPYPAGGGSFGDIYLGEVRAGQGLSSGPLHALCCVLAPSCTPPAKRAAPAPSQALQYRQARRSPSSWCVARARGPEASQQSRLSWDWEHTIAPYPLVGPQESVRVKHPQLLYESKLYKILQGGGARRCAHGGGGVCRRSGAQPQRQNRSSVACELRLMASLQ